jgi:hypothetical protein
VTETLIVLLSVCTALFLGAALIAVWNAVARRELALAKLGAVFLFASLACCHTLVRMGAR